MPVYRHKATGLSVQQICMLTGETPNTVRGWIYRKHIHRNEHGLIDAEVFWAYWETREPGWNPGEVVLAEPGLD